MNISDLFKSFSNKRDNIKSEVEVSDMIEKEGSDECYLDVKIAKFLEWYQEQMLSSLDENVQREEVMDLRNFIEKVAVWYEFRYSDRYIDKRLDNCFYNDSYYMSEIMLDEDKYLVEMGIDLKKSDWSDFYSTKFFLNNLSEKERGYLWRPRYPKFVSFPGGKFADGSVDACPGYIGLTAKGKISDIAVLCYSGSDYLKQFKGKSLKEFYEALKDKEFIFGYSRKNDLEDAILRHENDVFFKEKLLDSIMYRIIERGGAWYGARRGYLFAKEFDRNRDIPMMYGMVSPDESRRAFVNLYLKDGGDKDLKGYYNYWRYGDKEIEMVSVLEYLNDCDWYTIEEQELYQRLLNTFVKRKCELNAETQGENLEQKNMIVQKRIMRKLAKARNK